MHEAEKQLPQIPLPTLGCRIIIMITIQQQRSRQRGPLALQSLRSRELRQQRPEIWELDCED